MIAAPTVFVIDDDAAVRESLTLLLQQENFHVETFASAEDFLAASHTVESRSCAIVDLHMPGMGGLQLQQEMSQRGILVPIIFLTGHGDIPDTVRAIQAGAVNFLTKPIAGVTLLHSVQAAFVVSEELSTSSRQARSAAARLATLTGREREVMELAVLGLTNKEIAQRLGISYRTVEIHKARVMQKTESGHLLDLVRIAEAAGLGR